MSKQFPFCILNRHHYRLLVGLARNLYDKRQFLIGKPHQGTDGVKADGPQKVIQHPFLELGAAQPHEVLHRLTRHPVSFISPFADQGLIDIHNGGQPR